MQTRSIDINKKPEPTAQNMGGGASNEEFSFNDLPKQKPINLGDVNKMLSAQPQVAVQKEIDINASEKNAVDLSVTLSSNLGADWTRQELPSLGLPYDFKEVFLKTITIPVLAKIHAAKVNTSLTLLIDALNHCCSIDLRNLTPSDFTFVMYWLRDNSLPRSSMKIEYTTKYNNRIELNTRASNMKITELNMTKEEIATWRKKGIVFPTVRDAELIHRNAELDEDKRWMLEYAQYVEYIPGIDAAGRVITNYSDYIDRKLARLEELGLGILTEIDTFAGLISHGIDETIVVRDPKFDPLAAAKFFEGEAKKIVDVLNAIPESEVAGSSAAMLALAEQSHEFISMAKEIYAKLDAGEKVVADEEVVAVNISATDFFPGIRS